MKKETFHREFQQTKNCIHSYSCFFHSVNSWEKVSVGLSVSCDDVITQFDQYVKLASQPGVLPCPTLRFLPLSFSRLLCFTCFLLTSPSSVFKSLCSSLFSWLCSCCSREFRFFFFSTIVFWTLPEFWIFACAPWICFLGIRMLPVSDLSLPSPPVSPVFVSFNMKPIKPLHSASRVVSRSGFSCFPVA